MPPPRSASKRRPDAAAPRRNQRSDGNHRGSAHHEKRRAPKASTQHLKKEKAKYHQEKFQRERGQHGSASPRRAPPQAHARRTPHSHRTNDVDMHMAAKVASELRNDISLMKAKQAASDRFGPDLNNFFALVPPPFVAQHLPDEVLTFRTYMSRFQRGARNAVDAFTMWFEWASYENTKGKSFRSNTNKTDEDDAEKTEETATKMSQSRRVMAQTLAERQHIQALLKMCLRHNSSHRKAGQHAFINHLKTKLQEEDVDCRSLDRLRATAHHSVVHALSRILLGMATENLAMIVFHCQALYLVLTQTAITPAVVLSVLEEELALSARLKAVRLRLDAKHKTDGGDAPADNSEDDEDAIDPDEINDPTRGERNQRLTAAVFALGAVVASKRTLTAADVRQIGTYLSFCYVQQKATRVISANTLFALLQRTPAGYADEDVMHWATFAFFFYPKLEYFRPEAVQFVLRLMELEAKPAVHCFPATVDEYMHLDPLQPAVLEQMVNALFRREQVTAVHPMLHPVWDDLFELVQQRVAAGESMKEHLSTIVHTVIAPYRRGNADIPRRTLFQTLVNRLGQLAVQSESAEQRTELLHMASKNVGYGKRTTAKPTPLVELRQLPISALDGKVMDLLHQYRITKDTDPAASTNRVWVLRELRNCLYLPVRNNVDCPYVNAAVEALLEFGFFPPGNSRDEPSKNRCVYLFADIFSFTYTAALARPKCTIPALRLISRYLKAEDQGRTRYTTALQHSAFRKGRNRIVEALERAGERSVLFYDKRDVEVLFTLLFLILSVDDPSNDDAKTIATSVVPDLVQFFLTGTLESLDLLFDVLMALIMRTSSPLQVMPLMTCARRIATGFILKFSKFVKSKSTLDLILSPLREAFHTDSRELARQSKARAGAADGGDDDDDDDDDEALAAAHNEEHDGDDVASASAEDDEDAENDDDGSSSSSSATSTASESDEEDSSDGTEVDAAEVDDDDGATEEARSDADEPQLEEEEEDEDELDIKDEEPPTQQYVDALKGMVGNIDLEHSYPIDTANKEKSDVVRAVQLAARVGLAMRSPLVVHIYQVLLAVCREHVKGHDDVVFNSAIASLEMLLMTKNRYFGTFVPATDLFQLLADIQSYSRKLDRALLSKDSTTARAAALARRRMLRLKGLAIRVFHFVSLLAYKNHAAEDVRVTLSEYYKSIFCDRGWDMKRLLPGLKKDLYYYRQGFTWALLPAVFEKFDEIAAVDGPQRVRVFTGCCTVVESMLSRLSGLPTELKVSGSAAIRQFLQSVTLQQVYAMKHTLPYTYLHAIKMVLQYNSRVHLDTAWVSSAIVDTAIEDDDVLLSAASIRTVAAMERLLEKTPRIRETKAPVPVKTLYQQFDKTGAKEKGEFYKKAKRVRAKILKSLLAYRNDEPTDAERAAKRRRREELKVEDRLQRQVLRQAQHKVLTKEEREEKRKHILMAKQERIAKNRERKRRLHELRQKSFEQWREAKLAAAAAGASAEDMDSDNEA